MKRVLTAASALVALCGLSACTGGSSSGSASSSPTPSSHAPATRGTPVDPASVAAKLRRGLAPAKSAHLVISTRLDGETLSGHGDVALSKGTITAADVTQQLPSGLGTIRVVRVGGTDYAKLPGGLASSGKPWARLSASSSNPVVSQIASVVNPLLAVASPSTLVAFADASRSARRLGTGTRGGVPATEYTLAVDLAEVPSSVAAGLRNGSGGTTPVQLWLDGQGRPVQVTGTLPIAGQQVTPTITLTKYGQPVSISAPPAGRISSG